MRHLLLLRIGLSSAAAKQATDEAASALDAVGGLAGNGLAALSDTAARLVQRTRARDGSGHVAALVVLALALGAVDTLLGNHIANGLEETALTDLAGGEVVHAILESVDLLDTGDLALIECI